MDRLHEKNEVAPKDLRLFEILPEVEDYLGDIQSAFHGLQKLMESHSYYVNLHDFGWLSDAQISTCKQGVYFIAPDGVNAVKIGMTNSGLKTRMSQIQTCNPGTIRALLFIKTESANWWESVIQTLYRNYHIHGEWFVRDRVIDHFLNNELKIDRLFTEEDIFERLHNLGYQSDLLRKDVKIILPSYQSRKEIKRSRSLRDSIRTERVWDVEVDE